jgi:hypothetical protein
MAHFLEGNAQPTLSAFPRWIRAKLRGVIGSHQIDAIARVRHHGNIKLIGSTY